MIKFLLFLFLLSTTAFSQTVDSLKVKKDSSSTDSSFVVKQDTSAASFNDSTLTEIKVDTLKPIYRKPFDINSSYINRNTLLKYVNYKYTADQLRSFPFTFIKDFGFMGYPNEVVLYGAGSGGVSYFQDGILYNNRFTNSLDLHLIQSEFLDSVEIVPSPRGFIYGSINNPVSVNFITRDFLSAKPYSRIKYVQGPNGETGLDAMFSSLIFNRLKASFDVESRKIDSSFTNTSFSTWLAKVRLKYFLSNRFNLIAGYDFYKINLGFNGGVDVDSILQTTSNINSLLYDQIFAPVVFPNRKQNVNGHLFTFEMLSKPFENAETDLNLYYKFNQTEITNGLYNLQRNKNKTLGLVFRQGYSAKFADLNITANYEEPKIYLHNSSFGDSRISENNFSLSSILTFNLLDTSIIPSVFYKFTSNSLIDGNQNGLGTDLSYKPFNFLSLYLGISQYKTDAFNKNVNTGEFGLSFSKFDLLLNLKIYNRSGFYVINNPDYYVPANKYYINENGWGIGMNLNYRFWKLLLETASYYNMPSDKNPDNNNYSYTLLMPDVNLTGGLYYKDILFNENLNIKTGIVVYYIGKQESKYNGSVAQSVDPSWKIDFSLIGEIQKVAIVYFTWENLLDTQYYIVPYYPMLSRSIRFGLAWELFN